MTPKYQLDKLDYQILSQLQRDGRKPYLEIARELLVSGGTIHQRIQKMEEAGVLKGFRAVIDHAKLGSAFTVMVGLHLKNAKDCTEVLAMMEKFPEIVETHFTTGTYSLMIKVATSSIHEYYDFLTNKLQNLKEIRATESFICLSSPLVRDVSLEKVRG
jgi:Lrp/AsnC family transcriptional regulator, regulator for asnA, asnC and gidA